MDLITKHSTEVSNEIQSCIIVDCQVVTLTYCLIHTVTTSAQCAVSYCVAVGEMPSCSCPVRSKQLKLRVDPNLATSHSALELISQKVLELRQDLDQVREDLSLSYFPVLSLFVMTTKRSLCFALVTSSCFNVLLSLKWNYTIQKVYNNRLNCNRFSHKTLFMNNINSMKGIKRNTYFERFQSIFRKLLKNM